jgi:hypothetical protein
MKLKEMQLMFDNDLLTYKGRNAYIYYLQKNNSLEVDINKYLKLEEENNEKRNNNNT